MLIKTRSGLGAVICLVAALPSLPGLAQGEDADALDPVIVHGRAFELIGSANAATEGVVGYADFEDRPLSRVGELGARLERGPWRASLALFTLELDSELVFVGDAGTTEPTTLVNLAGSYDWRNVTLSLELLNALDAEDADITYFFESQLPGEAAPVEDIHFHPVEPRQVRLSLRYNF